MLPRSFGIERTCVMPGTKEPKDLASEGTGEQAIDFVESPNNWSVDFRQCLTTNVSLKINAGAPFSGPCLLRQNVEVKLIGNQLGKRLIEHVDRFKMRRAETLEIREHNLRSSFTRHLKPTRQ